MDKNDSDSAKSEIEFLLDKIKFNSALQRLIICLNKSDLITHSKASEVMISLKNKLTEGFIFKIF